MSPYFNSKDEKHKKKWLNRKDYSLVTLENAQNFISERKNYDLTDTGNAHRFIDKFGENIRYNVDNKVWMIWNGSYWQYDLIEQIKNYVDILAEEMLQDVYAIHDTATQARMFKNIEHINTSYENYRKAINDSLVAKKLFSMSKDCYEKSANFLSWKKLWQYETIILNGKTYKKIRYFEKKLNEAIEHLIQTVKPTVMHGDYCFSNILFDTNSFLCKLIDPRGRLHDQTIYGDPRYDIAKLRHSVVGAYDYAVHGLFRLTEEKNNFIVTDNYPVFQDKLTSYFDKMVIQFGYQLDEIKLIEALLFTSMIPLHKDSMERQKLFYLKAVLKINDIFERK